MSRKSRTRTWCTFSILGLLVLGTGCHDRALDVLDVIFYTAEVAEFWLLAF